MRSEKAAERRRSLITGLLAVGIFLALHPIVTTYYSTRFLGGSVGDGGLYVWLVQSFINDPLRALTFETNALYPYPLTRAWSDLFFLPSFIVSLFMNVGLTFPAAYNSLILLTFASNAVTCALLARRIGLAPVFATSVGILFANSSYIVGNLGHPQLLFFFWIPLAWWCVLPSTDGMRASSRSWWLAGSCVAGAFYCAVYYAVFATIGLAIIWFLTLLNGRISSRRALRTILFVVLGAAPIIYALPSYFAIQRQFGTRGLHEAAHFAATGLSYLSFAPLHDIFSRSAALSHNEAHLSPGYLVLCLALISITFTCWQRSRILASAMLLALGTLLISSSVIDQSDRSEQLLCVSAWVVLLGAVAYTFRERSALGCLALIVAVFFIFSLGPGGNPHKHEPAFSPLGLLFSRVPGLASIRAVGRYGSVVVLGAFIAAAFCVQRYITAHRRRALEIPPFAAAFVLVIAGLVENLTTTIPFDAPISAPQAFTALSADTNALGATLVLPFAEQKQSDAQESASKIAILNSRYALWESSSHSPTMRLVNGYSGQRSKIQLQLPRATRNFPDSAALDYLAHICGLRYVVVVPNLYERWDETLFTQRLSENAASIRAVQRFDDGSILLTLAERDVRGSGGVLSPFFAPRDGPVRLRVAPLDSEQCSFNATSLGKTVDGARISLQSSEYTVKHEQIITLAPPTSLLGAAPHLIELQLKECSIEVRCELVSPHFS